MCLRSDGKKYYFVCAEGACTVGQESCLRLVAFLSRCGESQRKSWSDKSGFRPLCSFLILRWAATRVASGLGGAFTCLCFLLRHPQISLHITKVVYMQRPAICTEKFRVCG
jgi:hypothetical protein